MGILGLISGDEDEDDQEARNRRTVKALAEQEGKAKAKKEYERELKKESIKEAKKEALQELREDRQRAGGVVETVQGIKTGLADIADDIGVFKKAREGNVSHDADRMMLGGGDSLEAELDEDGRKIYQKELAREMAKEKRRRLKKAAKEKAREDSRRSGGGGVLPDQGASGILLGDSESEGGDTSSLAEEARKLI